MADEMRRFIVFDRWGAYVRDMERVVSAEHTEQLNGADTLVIKTTEELARGQRIVWRDHTGAWHEHEVGEIVEARDGAGEPLITATCRSSICELEGDYLVDVQPSGSASLILSRALSESRWTVGTVDVAGSDAMVFYHMSAYAAVQKVVERFGGEVRADIAVTPSTGVTGRSVSLLAHRGQTDPTRRFDYGRDVQGIKRTVDESAVITALYAWGKGEEMESGGYGRRIGIAGVTSDHLPYVHNDAANEVWGRGDGGYVFGELVLQDVTDPHVLLDRANKYLAEHCDPLVSYSATVEQFGAAGLDLTGVSLGDDVQVVDSYHERELRLTARVVKLKRDLLNDRVIDVTLGNVLPTSATSKTKLEGAVSRLIDNEAVTDAMQAASAVYVERVIDRLNDMFDVGGGYVEMDVTKGLTFTNGPDFASSTMALNLSGAGFRIANSKTAGGDWDWRTFGTGAGFTADEIVAGILKAGIIQDVFGMNSWNLDTGEFHLGAGSTIDGVAASDVLASIDDAQNAANDENIIPYTANMDTAHGWTKSNATLNGDDSGVIASYTGTLDWLHSLSTPEMALSDIWDREATFSFDGSATGGSATVRLELDVYREGSTSRFAWIGLADLTVTTTAQRISHTFTAGSSTGWSFSSQDDTEFNGTDRVRIRLLSRTLSRTVTLSKWKLQSGGEATPWRPAKSDASSLMAERVATNYVTDISSAGIKVHPSGSSSDYISITGVGMEVFKGSATVAQFGETARVGKLDDYHSLVNSTGFHVINADNDTIAEIKTDILGGKQYSRLYLEGETGSEVVFNTSRKGTTSYIRVIDDGDDANNGNEMIVVPGSNLLMGGGEAAISLFNAGVGADSNENAYYAADGTTYIMSNCQTVANRYVWEYTTAGHIFIQNSNLTSGVAPSTSTMGRRIVWKDVNGNVIGRIAPWFRTDGHQGMRFYCCRKNGSTNAENFIDIGFDSSGNRKVEVAEAAPFRAGIGVSYGHCVRLYNKSDGSTGTITLSSAASGFTILDIVYGDTQGNYYTARVYSPNGKNTRLAYAINGTVTDGQIYISGTSITRTAGTAARIYSVYGWQA